MTRVYRIIALMLLILLVRSILTIVLGTLNMGGTENPGLVNFNRTVFSVIEFPLNLIKSYFPKVINHQYFWSFQNIAFILANTFIQACGLYVFGKWLNKRL